MKKSVLVTLAAMAVTSQALAQMKSSKPDAVRRLETKQAADSAAKGAGAATRAAVTGRQLDLSSATRNLSPNQRVELGSVLSSVKGASEVIDTAIAHIGRPEVRNLAETAIESVSNMKRVAASGNLNSQQAEQAHSILVLEVAKQAISSRFTDSKTESLRQVVESILKETNIQISLGKSRGEALELALSRLNSEDFKLEIKDINNFCRGGLSADCVTLLSSGKKPVPRFTFNADAKQSALEQLTSWFKAQDTLRFFPSPDYVIRPMNGKSFDGMNRQHGQFFTLTHVLKTLTTDLSQSMISSQKAMAQQKVQLKDMKKELDQMDSDIANLPKQKLELENRLKQEEEYSRTAPSVLGEARIEMIKEGVERLRNQLEETKLKIMRLPTDRTLLEQKMRSLEESVANGSIANEQRKTETKARDVVMATAQLLGDAVSKHFRTEEAMLRQYTQETGKTDDKFRQDYLAKHFEEHRTFEAEMEKIIQDIRGIGTSPEEIKRAATALAIKIDTWLILHIKVNDTLTYDKMSR